MAETSVETNEVRGCLPSVIEGGEGPDLVAFGTVRLTKWMRGHSCQK